MARTPQKLKVEGLWGGENTAVDPTLISPLESPDMKNVDVSSEGGVIGVREGRRLHPGLSMPIVSEWENAASGASSGGRIRGIFEHTDKKGGTFALIAHAKGVDHIERRGPVLYISTQDPLAAGTEGSAYSVTITCIGGKSTYTWSILKGTLPPGLALGGETDTTETIIGTPGRPGSDPTVYTFTIAVEDSSVPPQKAAKRLSISISQNNPM